MKKYQLLGCSSDTIAIVMDLLSEQRPDPSFKVYRNTDLENPINFIHRTYHVEILSKEQSPDIMEEVFFGVSGPANKHAVYHHFLHQSGHQQEHYLTVQAKDGYVAPSARIERGVLLEPSTVVSSQSTIGFGVFVKRGSLIGHHNIIGDFTDINPGVVISGKVTIGKGCTLGSGSVIGDNLTIGDNTIIGMGSVVVKNIPSGVIAYGNPCKVIRTNDQYHI